MRICKNHFDILIKPTKCSECAFKRKIRPCFWVKLMIPKYILDCGGIRATSLSDIFKL